MKIKALLFLSLATLLLAEVTNKEIFMDKYNPYENSNLKIDANKLMQNSVVKKSEIELDHNFSNPKYLRGVDRDSLSPKYLGNIGVEAIDSYRKSSDFQEKLTNMTDHILHDKKLGYKSGLGQYRDNTLELIAKAHEQGSIFKENEKIFIVISSSMPKQLIQTYFESAEFIGDKSIKFILNGFIGSPKKIKPTLDWLDSMLTKDVNSNEKFAVSVDINPKIVQHYNIDAVPAILYTENYNKLLEDHNGFIGTAEKNESFHLIYGAVDLNSALKRLFNLTGSLELKNILKLN